MSGLPFSVKIVDWVSHKQSLSAIRETVFVHEQSVPATLEADANDVQYIHVLACLNDATPVGTARLLPDGLIGRMAVLQQYRKTGIGVAMLKALVAHARDNGLSQVFLNAQLSAEGFYKKVGFISEGDVFMDAGIEHRRMRLFLL